MCLGHRERANKREKDSTTRVIARYSFEHTHTRARTHTHTHTHTHTSSHASHIQDTSGENHEYIASGVIFERRHMEQKITADITLDHGVICRRWVIENRIRR